MFGNRKGDPLRESKLLTNVLQAAVEADGLGRVTWHQVRHIHSSLLNDLKVPLKIMETAPRYLLRDRAASSVKRSGIRSG